VFYALNNEISVGNPIFAGKRVLVVHTGGVWTYRSSKL
jgi:hypothetical protein